MQGLCHRGVSSFLCPGGNAAGLQTPVARQLNPKKEVLLEGEGKRTSKQEAFQEISLLHQHMFHPQFLQTDKCAIKCPFYQKFFDSHSELIKKKTDRNEDSTQRPQTKTPICKPPQTDRHKPWRHRPSSGFLLNWDSTDRPEHNNPGYKHHPVGDSIADNLLLLRNSNIPHHPKSHLNDNLHCYGDISFN